jgi:hypothetical protein
MSVEKAKVEMPVDEVYNLLYAHVPKERGLCPLTTPFRHVVRNLMARYFSVLNSVSS